MAARFSPLILVLGVGEFASAVAHRLFKARFRVLMTEDQPLLELRRYTSFSRVFEKGACEVEGVPARQVVVTDALGQIDRGGIPILSVDARSAVDVLNPEILVDARDAWRLALEAESRGGIKVGDVSLIIAATPRFTIGDDCDMAVVIHRGHDLGRAVTNATDKTADIARELEAAAGPSPVLEAVSAEGGLFKPLKRIGDQVAAGEALAEVGEERIASEEGGMVKGLLQSGVLVPEGCVVAEIDRTGREEAIYSISDQGRGISGTVLEMVVAWSLDVGALYQPGSYFHRE
jgi:xanthine dehydrogenase accessory factor